jgi:hypothetical protein
MYDFLIKLYFVQRNKMNYVQNLCLYNSKAKLVELYRVVCKAFHIEITDQKTSQGQTL